MAAAAGSPSLTRAPSLQRDCKQFPELCVRPVSSLVSLYGAKYGLSSPFTSPTEAICWIKLKSPIRSFACHHQHSQVPPSYSISILEPSRFYAFRKFFRNSDGRTPRCSRRLEGSRRKNINRLTSHAAGPDDEHDNVNSTKMATEESEDSEPTSSAQTSQEVNHPHALGRIVIQMDGFNLLDLLNPENVDPEDVKLLKERVFGYSTFWVTGQEPFGDRGAGILFLGNLRGKREEVFAKVQHKLREVTGSKYNLFMVEEPNSDEQDPRGGPRVSFILLRKETSDPKATTLWQFAIAFVLFIITTGSCLELGIASQLSKLPPEVVRFFTNPEVVEPPDLNTLFPYVKAAVPLTYGVLGLQLFHEVGHFLAAARKKVKLGIPYFIPNITLGSFGAITEFKSILPDRTAKFDISISGPLAGGVLSLAMLGVGLLLSTSPEATRDLVQVPGMLFQGSLLLGYLSRSVLGYTAMHASSVYIHPLVLAGWCGLTTTAFNLLPVGRLDGGRVMQAAFGNMSLTVFALGTYLLLGVGVLGGPLSLPWGLYILICQRDPEKPCLNDVTEVGRWRQGIYTVTLIIVVLILLPFWDGRAEELGIGLGSPLI